MLKEGFAQPVKPMRRFTGARHMNLSLCKYKRQ